MKDLKLYYWDDVLTDHSSGCAIALACSIDEAKKMILEKYIEDNPKQKDCRYSPYQALVEELKQEPKVYDVNTKNVFYCEGGS